MLLYSPKHCRKVMVLRSITCLAAETLPLLDVFRSSRWDANGDPDNCGDAP